MQTKLTDEVSEKIIQMVRSGVFLKDAAEFHHVGESTARNWKTRGDGELASIERGERNKARKSERRYVEFSEGFAQARSHANISDLTTMALAAQNDPQWAERRLRLRNPSWFREEVDVTSREEVTVTHGYADEYQGDEEARRASEVLRRRSVRRTSVAHGPSVPGDE